MEHDYLVIMRSICYRHRPAATCSFHNSFHKWEECIPCRVMIFHPIFHFWKFCADPALQPWTWRIKEVWCHMYCHAIGFLLNSRKKVCNIWHTHRADSPPHTAESDVEYYEVDHSEDFMSKNLNQDYSSRFFSRIGWQSSGCYEKLRVSRIVSLLNISHHFSPGWRIDLQDRCVSYIIFLSRSSLSKDPGQSYNTQASLTDIVSGGYSSSE